MEKFGTIRKLKEGPPHGKIGTNVNAGGGGIHKVSTSQEYAVTLTNKDKKVCHVTHAWDSDDIFRTLPRSEVMLESLSKEGGIVGTFVYHGANDIVTPAKINKEATDPVTTDNRLKIAKWLKTHAPYTHVRLRKVRVWIYCPEPGVGFIAIQYGSTGKLQWAEEAPHFETIGTDYAAIEKVEAGNKWGWLGMEFAPPIAMGMTDWHPLSQYAKDDILTGSALLQQPHQKADLSELPHIFVVFAGMQNPNFQGNFPGNSGWIDTPANKATYGVQAIRHNMVYKFYWETLMEQAETAYGSIVFASAIAGDGDIVETKIVSRTDNIPKFPLLGRITCPKEQALIKSMDKDQRVCYMQERSVAQAKAEKEPKMVTMQNKLAQQRPTKVRVPEVQEEPRHFGWGYSKKGVLHDAYGLPVQQEDPNREDRSRSIEERIMMKLECIENDLTLQGQAHSALCDDMELLHEKLMQKEDEEMLGNDEDDSFICDDEELSMDSETECSDDEDDFNPPKLFKKDTLILDAEDPSMDETLDEVIELEEGLDVPEYEGNPFHIDNPF